MSLCTRDYLEISVAAVSTVRLHVVHYLMSKEDFESTVRLHVVHYLMSKVDFDQTQQ